jgi:hypothetical protein
MDDNKKELNMLPFFSQALSYKSFIYSDIDNLYQKHKLEMYLKAKNSEFYECFFSNQLSIEGEEYYKKSLGILLFANDYQNEEIGQEVIIEIIQIFKKEYKKIFNEYIKNKKELDILKIKFYNEKMSDEAFNNNIISLIFLAIHSDIKTKNMEKIYSTLFEMWENYFKEDAILRIKKENKLLKMETIKKLINEYKLTDKDYMKESIYTFIYDYESLSSVSLYDNVDFNTEDIEELVYLYISYNDDIVNKEQFECFMEDSFHIKVLCKAYRKAKEFHKRNNQENLFLEVDNAQKEAEKYKNLYIQEKISKEQLIQKKELELIEKEKEISLLKNKINKMSLNNKEDEAQKDELISLRNFMFENSNSCAEEQIDVSINELINNINNCSIAIIGGHPNWQKKMKEYLNKVTFISVEVTLNEDIIRDKNLIIFNTSYLNHSIYYKAINVINRNNIKIAYINDVVNTSLAIKKIYKIIQHLKLKDEFL